MLRARQLNNWAAGTYAIRLPRLIWAICLILCLWQAASALAQESSVTLEGQVVNGTSGGGIVAGVPVLLHQEGPAGVTTLDTTTDQLGRFLFDGIIFDSATAYGVSVRYQGALYGLGLDLSQ